MTERSLVWGGSSTGDAALAAPYGAPYGDDMFSDMMSMMSQYNRSKSGVIASARTGFSGNLAPTIAGDIITVGSGIAMIDGKIYYSDASVNHTLTTNGTFSVVLRKSWASQTVRQVLIATTAITNNDGSTWDVELCRATRSGGTVTAFYDVRAFCDGSVPEKVIVPHSYGSPSGLSSSMYTMLDATFTSVAFWFELPWDITTSARLEFLIGNDSSPANMVYSVYANGDKIVSPTNRRQLFSLYEQTMAVGTLESGTYSLWVYSGLLTVEFTGDTLLQLMEYRGHRVTGAFSRNGSHASDTASSLTLHGIRFVYT